MKLICERVDEVEYLTEESPTGAKQLYIKGVMLQAGITNRNGRFYPHAIMESAANSYIAERVRTNTAYGELNHPETPAIDLERAAIRIVELAQDRNDWIGKALVLNTPMGNITRGLLEGECKLGVSSRGMGSLRREGGKTMVCEDFRLSTAADIVSNPSAPDAFVNGIMEGVEWVYDEKNGYQALELVEQVQRQHHKQMLNEEQRLRAFKLFIDRIKTATF